MFKIQNLKKVTLVVFFVAGIFFLTIDVCQAAVLYLSPENQTVNVGDTFIQEIKIDTQEPINAIEYQITYSPDILEAVDFSLGNSILTVVAQGPVIDQENGLISFAGGLPGGYTGKIFGGLADNNLVGRIIFRALKDSQSEILIGQAKVLLHDGFGTEAELIVRNAQVEILVEEPGFIQDQWQEEINKDTIPPELFQLQIIQDSSIFDGQHVLIFSTTDKQTGIDYYEVREGNNDWQEAESPYLIIDQKLNKIINVKAVDKAGNERIESMKPVKPFPYWIIVLILIILGIGFWFIVQRK